MLSFEISGKSVESVRRECLRIEYPMLEEYEFRKGLAPVSACFEHGFKFFSQMT